MFGRTRRCRFASAWMLTVALSASHAAAYEGAVHQQLTFIAARQYNQCVADTHLQRLTPLQVRYIAKANANQADEPWWQRLFRWNYYDRSQGSAGKFLWLLETRMHNSFHDTLQRLDAARDLSRRFTNLGRVVSYLQDATTPSHVVPVFTTRWWRFSTSDRLNSFAVNVDALNAAIGEDCVDVRSADGTFEKLLTETADRTLAAVLEPIRGMPSTWQAFWELDNDDDDFGSYGDAGNNFGRQTTFRCTDDRERDCVLLAGDPLYAEFAQARHLDAVRATIGAMTMMQQQIVEVAALEATQGRPVNERSLVSLFTNSDLSSRQRGLLAAERSASGSLAAEDPAIAEQVHVAEKRTTAEKLPIAERSTDQAPSALVADAGLPSSTAPSR